MARVIFQQASVLDGSNPLVPGMNVVVDGDRVATVTHDAVAECDGDRVIDLAGKVLMPGMVTAHGHLVPGEPRSFPQGVLMAIAIKNCRTILQSGFTAVAGAGTSYHIDTQLKTCMDEGLVVGPRITPASARINTSAYVNDHTPWWKDLNDTSSDVYVDGPEAMRHAVRMEIRAGAEIIKLFPTGGRGVRQPRVPGLSRDELLSAVDSAHERGAMVRAHAVWIEQVRDCIEAGVDIIDHADELDERCIELMVEKGTFWVPSLGLVALRGLEHRSVIKSDWENVAKMLLIANDAGVKILAGDDYGVPDMPHELGAYARDMIVCVDEFGIKPLDVIRWATRHGADLMGLAGQAGTVAAGALADLVVIDGDPSSDLSILRDPASNIDAVMKGGVFVKDALV